MSEPTDGTGIGEGTGTNTNQEGSQTQNKEINYEEIAAKTGWKPLDQFDGDEENWVEAKEFVKRKSFFDKIFSGLFN